MGLASVGSRSYKLEAPSFASFAQLPPQLLMALLQCPSSRLKELTGAASYSPTEKRRLASLQLAMQEIGALGKDPVKVLSSPEAIACLGPPYADWIGLARLVQPIGSS